MSSTMSPAPSPAASRRRRQRAGRSSAGFANGHCSCGLALALVVLWSWATASTTARPTTANGLHGSFEDPTVSVEQATAVALAEVGHAFRLRHGLTGLCVTWRSVPPPRAPRGLVLTACDPESPRQVFRYDRRVKALGSTATNGRLCVDFAGPQMRRCDDTRGTQRLRFAMEQRMLQSIENGTCLASTTAPIMAPTTVKTEAPVTVAPTCTHRASVFLVDLVGGFATRKPPTATITTDASASASEDPTIATLSRITGWDQGTIDDHRGHVEEFVSGRPARIRSLDRAACLDLAPLVGTTTPSPMDELPELAPTWAPCSSTSPTQVFRYDPETFQIRPQSRPRTCLADDRSRALALTRYRFQWCPQEALGSSQRFRFDAINLMIPTGRRDCCLDTAREFAAYGVDSAESNATTLTIWPCDPTRPSQKFMVDLD